ncbi:protein translocase subunit [Vanrija albida]|uniref:Mitochondrial import inner membrane translocase subunit TIM44 n=1 Tax=Vanrija albida TaxID=181172 RepID=A0ABR3Q910_9TREE
MKPRAASLQALRAPLQGRRAALPAVARPAGSFLRPLSSTSVRFNESKEKATDDAKDKTDDAAGGKKKEEKRKASADDDDHGPPQSPFQVFLRVFREEIHKNQGWQSNVKQLQGDVDKLADSAAMKKARDVYERTRIANLMKENPRLAQAAADLKKAGISMQDAVSQALNDSEVLKALARYSNSVSAFADRATAPVRDTAAYKAIASSFEEAFDDASGGAARYGGYTEKEERRKRRERRLLKAGKTTKRVAANPDAGEALVLTSEKEPTTSRLNWLTSHPTYQRLRENYYESESPAVETLRSVTSTIAGWFDENETAKVIRTIREIDPDFNIDNFTRELREYIVPEVVDAYLSADRESLKQWCGEATFNVLWATMGQYVKQGLVSESKIMDIKHVDIVSGKLLENDVPVFVISFASQEVLLFKNAKTGENVVGDENAVEQCRYAMVLTRVESEIDNELTNGWKVVEMARRGQKSFM